MTARIKRCREVNAEGTSSVGMPRVARNRMTNESEKVSAVGQERAKLRKLRQTPRQSRRYLGL